MTVSVVYCKGSLKQIRAKPHMKQKRSYNNEKKINIWNEDSETTVTKMTSMKRTKRINQLIREVG